MGPLQQLAWTYLAEHWNDGVCVGGVGWGDHQAAAEALRHQRGKCLPCCSTQKEGPTLVVAPFPCQVHRGLAGLRKGQGDCSSVQTAEGLAAEGRKVRARAVLRTSFRRLRGAELALMRRAAMGVKPWNAAQWRGVFPPLSVSVESASSDRRASTAWGRAAPAVRGEAGAEGLRWVCWGIFLAPR